jgi:hypothetical protein
MLKVPAKKVRAQLILQHLSAAGLPYRVLCLTCGNAAAALRACGLQVVEVGPRGLLQPARWLEPAEVAFMWPGLFDATSGHLSVGMMAQLGKRLRQLLGDDLSSLRVPSGSGETVVALALAYPHLRFTAVYGGGAPTQWNAEAPLNPLVAALCEVEGAGA